MGDEEIRVTLARLDERMKVVEASQKSMDAKMWGAVILIVAYVGNKLLGLLQFGGGP
jgi:hypothetical protein